MSMNRTTIMGRLVRDPELRRTANGTAVTTITLAVDRDVKNQNGERVADFFDVIAWRNTAEYVCKYFTKGRMAAVDGRLQTRAWTDKDGNKHKAVEIIAESIYFGDSRKSDDSGAPAAAHSAPASEPADSSFDGDDFAEYDDSDEDLPF